MSYDQKQLNFSNKGMVSSDTVESHDSCYSSCSEKSDSPLLRELSDNLAKEMGQLSMASTGAITTGAGIRKDCSSEQRFLQNVDFAIRLGYSVKQLKIVLEKVGVDARQVGKQNR